MRFASGWVRDEHALAGWFARDEGTLPTGVDVEGIRARRAQPPRTPPERLLFAGRIHRSKGLHVAVRALAEVPKGMTLSVAGPLDDAEYYEGVRQLARELGVFERIDWLGALPHRDEVLDLLASEDVLIYPSIAGEGYSLGLLEAFAAGILVVTSAPGGPREYLEHERNALVFEPGDASMLASQLRRLHEDPELVRVLAVGARGTAARLSLDRVVDQFEETLRTASRSCSAQR